MERSAALYKNSNLGIDLHVLRNVIDLNKGELTVKTRTCIFIFMYKCIYSIYVKRIHE